MPVTQANWLEIVMQLCWHIGTYALVHISYVDCTLGTTNA